jgi:hypothetical protein
LGAVLLGDPGGQLALAVVAMAEPDRPPLVDHRDRGGVRRDVVGVVGAGTEVGEVLDQAPESAVGADGAEGDRVPLCV